MDDTVVYFQRGSGQQTMPDLNQTEPMTEGPYEDPEFLNHRRRLQLRIYASRHSPNELLKLVEPRYLDILDRLLLDES